LATARPREQQGENAAGDDETFGDEEQQAGSRVHHVLIVPPPPADARPFDVPATRRLDKLVSDH
jgi:hypothetical protein